MLRYNYNNASGLPARQFGTNFGLSRYFYGRSDLHGFTVGEGFTDNLAGIPNGHLAPSSFILPINTGSISSYRELNITTSTSLLLGTPGLMVGAVSGMAFSTGGTANGNAFMVGAVLPTLDLTAEQVATAVWTANSASYTTNGIMGKQLNATKTNSDLIPATV
jgi:hypothetical protein